MTIFLSRLQKLRELLSGLKIDALLVDHPTNLFYLTGIELSTGKLLVAVEEAFLLVDGRYYEKCRQESPVPAILTSKTALQELLTKCTIHRLGFESGTTTVKQFQEMQKELQQCTLIPCDAPVADLRMIKDETELNSLREAALLGSQGYDFVLTQLKEGITEEEVAQELEIFWKKRGGKKVAFDPIIAFGPNTSMPHYRAGTARLQKGDPVLIDIGVVLNHYHSDMTRTLFFGKPDPRLQKIYEVVLEAQLEALKFCRPGVTAGAVDEAARKVITENGFGDYFVHSLGHGVGLDIHEAPSLRNSSQSHELVLQKGMVITIEPGIYLPQIGGVRIEDTVIITETGYEDITCRPKVSRPKTLKKL